MTKYPHLDAVLTDEQLHDGARLLCRRYHITREPCPCEDCIGTMLLLNETLSGIVFNNREGEVAKVIAIRDIVELRKQRHKEAKARGDDQS